MLTMPRLTHVASAGISFIYQNTDLIPAFARFSHSFAECLRSTDIGVDMPSNTISLCSRTHELMVGDIIYHSLPARTMTASMLHFHWFLLHFSRLYRCYLYYASYLSGISAAIIVILSRRCDDAASFSPLKEATPSLAPLARIRLHAHAAAGHALCRRKRFALPHLSWLPRACAVSSLRHYDE